MPVGDEQLRNGLRVEDERLTAEQHRRLDQVAVAQQVDRSTGVPVERRCESFEGLVEVYVGSPVPHAAT